MSWDDIQTVDDCITPAEWNNMVTYIKELSCPSKVTIDFYMYSDCSNSTGQKFKFSFSGDDSLLYGGSSTGDRLQIFANTTDSEPYILLGGDSNVTICSTSDIIFLEQTEQMFIFKENGTISEIWGSDDTGDDLFIYANTTDNCPVLELFGNSGASLLIKAGSIFDVSTCSGETLFEIDSGSPKHVNFHCLEAFEFRLELRTTDPSSPTCQGRLWFRTDLV